MSLYADWKTNTIKTRTDIENYNKFTNELDKLFNDLSPTEDSYALERNEQFHLSNWDVPLDVIIQLMYPPLAELLKKYSYTNDSSLNSLVQILDQRVITKYRDHIIPILTKYLPSDRFFGIDDYLKMSPENKIILDQLFNEYYFEMRKRIIKGTNPYVATTKLFTEDFDKFYFDAVKALNLSSDGSTIISLGNTPNKFIFLQAIFCKLKRIDRTFVFMPFSGSWTNWPTVVDLEKFCNKLRMMSIDPESIIKRPKKTFICDYVYTGTSLKSFLEILFKCGTNVSPGELKSSLELILLNSHRDTNKMFEPYVSKISKIVIPLYDEDDDVGSRCMNKFTVDKLALVETSTDYFPADIIFCNFERFRIIEQVEKKISDASEVSKTGGAYYRKYMKYKKKYCHKKLI